MQERKLQYIANFGIAESEVFYERTEFERSKFSYDLNSLLSNISKHRSIITWAAIAGMTELIELTDLSALVERLRSELRHPYAHGAFANPDGARCKMSYIHENIITPILKLSRVFLRSRDTAVADIARKMERHISAISHTFVEVTDYGGFSAPYLLGDRELMARTVLTRLLSDVCSGNSEAVDFAVNRVCSLLVRNSNVALHPVVDPTIQNAFENAAIRTVCASFGVPAASVRDTVVRDTPSLWSALIQAIEHVDGQQARKAFVVYTDNRYFVVGSACGLGVVVMEHLIWTGGDEPGGAALESPRITPRSVVLALEGKVRCLLENAGRSNSVRSVFLDWHFGEITEREEALLAARIAALWVDHGFGLEAESDNFGIEAMQDLQLMEQQAVDLLCDEFQGVH
eukprot:m51a1_g9313 hypothetical protein (401) ;mRNA; f:108615-109817